MSDMFNPVFTDAGRIAAAADNGQGLSTTITHVVLGSGRYAVRDDAGLPLSEGLNATALQDEQLRVPVYSGGSPGPGQLNLVAEITKATGDDPTFYISEVGFLDANGVLVCVWSHSSKNLGYRGDLGNWYLSLGLAWVDLPGDQFTVEVQNAPLAEQSLRLAQLTAQVKHAVESSDINYDPLDNSQLAAAMENTSNSQRLAGKTIEDVYAGAVQQVRAQHGNVIDVPAITGESHVVVDGSTTLTVSATSFLEGGAITDFTLTRPNGSTENATAVNGQAVFTTAVTGSVGSEQTFKVTATDNLGNISSPAQHVFSIVANQAPVMTGFSYDVPSVAVRGELITARFQGATDPDGDSNQVTYIIVDTAGVTASKTSGIGHNEAVTLTVDDITTDMSGSLTVKAVDQAGVQSIGALIPLDLRINMVPDISGLVHTLPAEGVRGATYNVTFNGAIDPDGDDSALTYELTSTSNISFSKTAGIAQGESLQATFSDLADGTPATFSIRAVDAQQGASSSQSISATIVRPPAGEVSFTSQGTHNWVVPLGITSVSAVCVGGGGAGGGGYSCGGGGGGGLAWKNNIAVTPGETILITVGQRGVNNSGQPDNRGTAGGTSSFGSIFSATGGSGGGQSGVAPTPGGTPVGGDGGGIGGRGGNSHDWEGPGGGGAGGYTGNGGDGYGKQGINSTAGSGGGGGGGYHSTYTPGGHGGGVGLNGQGEDGIRGYGYQPSNVGRPGGGGSGGNSAGQYGGGGGGAGGYDNSTRVGASGSTGAVRIIWGTSRSFPSNAA